MARHIPAPRKQRTRAHVIAAQSVNYLERFIIDEGHTAERVANDYGYDLMWFTYDEQGYVEPGSVDIQLEAAESLQASGTNYFFDLDVRDYNLWMAEPMPVFLVLFDATRRRAYWLYVQKYFSEDLSRRPQTDAKTVRVQVPQRQAISRRAVARMRGAKQAILDRMAGVLDHA